MATYTPPHLAKFAGIPRQGTDDIVVTPEALITGDIPAIFNMDMPIAASQTIAAYTVVGLNGSDQIVPAVLGTTAPIGITFIDIATDAGAIKAAPIYRGGVFNPAMLVWPATYDNDAKKMAAFNGAAAPTQIVIRAIKTGTVTLP
jgi:hypothetical protein